MNQAQLNNDLTEIERAVDRGDMPEPVKRVLRDMLEWNRGLVDQAGSQAKSTVERLNVIEDAVDELLNGAEEGISMETAKVIATALEQSRILCETIAATLLKSPFDDLTTERFTKLIKTCMVSIATADQVVQELVMPDEETDPDEVTTVPTAPGTKDDEAGDEEGDDEGDEEGDADADDEDADDEEEADNG